MRTIMSYHSHPLQPISLIPVRCGTDSNSNHGTGSLDLPDCSKSSDWWLASISVQ